MNNIEEISGTCIYTGLPTSLKHRGEWTSHHFIQAGAKLRAQYPNDFKEPEDAVDCILSALCQKAAHGEEGLDPNEVIKQEIKGAQSWKSKLKRALHLKK